MPKATISTGTVVFDSGEKNVSESASQDDPMHIVLLGDFTARANNRRLDSASVGERRLIEIDRDNFEQVFSSLGIELCLSVAESPLTFSEFDNLHPDYLYARLPLFDELRSLKRRLMMPEHFARAASEIRNWRGYRIESEQSDTNPDLVAEVDENLIPPGDLLDSVLCASGATTYSNTSEDSIDRLIKDIVAPYVSAKADPELPDLLDAVSQAGCELMRKVCHTSAFQQLEASWRSVYLLVRRLETDSKLKIFLVDLAKEEILENIASHKDSAEDSGLYQLLVERLAIPGATLPALINADYYIADDIEDLRLVAALGCIAQKSAAAVVCGARTILAGCADVSQTPDPADWSRTLNKEFEAQWELLRRQRQSRYVALAAPRFLLRLPYGKQTSPIESFDYSELPQNGAHQYYLWGNSAYLLTLLLATGYRTYGWSFRPGQIQLLEDFPLHVYTLDDGETTVKPCAEAMLTDSACHRLIEAGLVPVRSIKDRADITIPVLNALAEGSTLSGAWRN